MLLGLDAEMFLVRNGKAVAPHVILGPKSSPLHMDTEFATASWYRDGFLCEVNFELGIACRGHLITALARAITDMRKIIKTKLGEAYDLSISPAMPFAYDRDAPPDVVALGCLPSANAYDEPFKLHTLDPQSVAFRTAGCHFHFSQSGGFPPQDITSHIKNLDHYIGLPLTYLSGYGGLERQRRLLYGRSGEYRVTKYKSGHSGVEYRVPSAAVLTYPPLISLALGVGRDLLLGRSPLKKVDCERTRIAINEARGTSVILPSLKDWYVPEILRKAKLAISKYEGNLNVWNAFAVYNKGHDYGWYEFKNRELGA